MARALLGAILHFAAVRIRVLGTGNLRTTVITSNTISETLTPIGMSLTTEREPTALTNTRQPTAQVECKTTGIDEVFRIMTIRIFIKESSTGYPQ